MLTGNISVQWKAPSLRPDRQQSAGAVSRTGAVSLNRTPGAVKTQDSVQEKTVYVLQEAPKMYIRSLREAGAGSYRAALSQSRSRDEVNALHMQRMQSVMTDLAQADLSEAGFIGKHLNKLMEERMKFMNSEDYADLTWLSEPPAATAPVEPAEEPASIADSEETKAPASVGEPAETRNAEPRTETPEAAAPVTVPENRKAASAPAGQQKETPADLTGIYTQTH